MIFKSNNISSKENIIDYEIENMSLDEKIDMFNKFNRSMLFSNVVEIISGGSALSLEIYYIYKEILYYLKDSSHELDLKYTLLVSAVVLANTCLSISQGFVVEDSKNIIKKLEKSIKE